MRQRRILPFLLRWLILSTFLTPMAHAAMRKETMILVTASGRHALSVEITESQADKAMGLMFRQALGRREGMFFGYSKSFEITMWMKNTYISLDMIFIKKNGVVHRIAKGTEPFSESVVASQGDVLAVLEVAAGVADEIGLKAGDKIEHTFFIKK
jgi:uncharacterized membrane protein (UPF0127 family)